MFNLIPALVASAATAAFNKKSADDNKDFQAEMSSTAHQREVQDLIAAGLNPMLSAKLGGASSPGGSVATAPDFGAVMNNSKMVASTTAKQAAEVDLVKAQTKTAETQAALNEAQAVKAAADASVSMTNASQTAFNLEKAKYLEKEFDSWFVEGKEFDARLLKANYERLKASNDYNTLNILNEYAIDQGYRNFESAIQSQEFRQSLQNYLRGSLQISKETALSDFYKTDFGKEVAPFLGSANAAADLVGSGVAIGKSILGRPNKYVEHILNKGR